MTEFASYRSYWAFEQGVRRRNRYVHDSEVGAFLATLVATSEKRMERIGPAGQLWRAQLGHDVEPIHQGGEHIDDEPVPYSKERMKPKADRAPEGRANPKGIPYLYLATDRDTALAEVRPWIGSLISVGQFRLTRDLRVINCTNDRDGKLRFYLDGEPSPEERETSVWQDVDRAFSRPVAPSDDAADYIPTQIIAELLKSHGYDGIAYRSALGLGHNVALFDLGAAQLINCFLFQATAMKFGFNEAGTPYFVKQGETGSAQASDGA